MSSLLYCSPWSYVFSFYVSRVCQILTSVTSHQFCNNQTFLLGRLDWTFSRENFDARHLKPWAWIWSLVLHRSFIVVRGGMFFIAKYLRYFLSMLCEQNRFLWSNSDSYETRAENWRDMLGAPNTFPFWWSAFAVTDPFEGKTLIKTDLRYQRALHITRALRPVAKNITQVGDGSLWVTFSTFSRKNIQNVIEDSYMM